MGRVTTAGRVTLRFRDLPEVGSDLQRLVSAEAICCNFLGWDLSYADGEWRVVITGTEADLLALPSNIPAVLHAQAE